jgi:hypothetical protein
MHDRVPSDHHRGAAVLLALANGIESGVLAAVISLQMVVGVLTDGLPWVGRCPVGHTLEENA